MLGVPQPSPCEGGTTIRQLDAASSSPLPPCFQATSATPCAFIATTGLSASVQEPPNFACKRVAAPQPPPSLYRRPSTTHAPSSVSQTSAAADPPIATCGEVPVSIIAALHIWLPAP